MGKHFVRSTTIPSGIYKHVHSGDRIQVDWQPASAVTTRIPRHDTAYHKLGEFVVMAVNAIGWMVLAFTLFIGLLDIVTYQFDQLPEEEVTDARTQE